MQLTVLNSTMNIYLHLDDSIAFTVISITGMQRPAACMRIEIVQPSMYVHPRAAVPYTRARAARSVTNILRSRC